MAIVPDAVLSQIDGWLICLKSDDPAERLEAATALRDLAKAQRKPSTVRTRDSLSHAADRRVTPELEKQIVAGIWDKHRQIRNTMARAVGELCGPDVVADLIAIARTERMHSAQRPPGPHGFAIAFKQAIDAFRDFDNGRFDHEFYWAPYTLYGLG